MQHQLAIVIPVYNERNDIAHLLTDVARSCNYPIIIVDDGSTDGTSNILQQINEKIFVVKHLKNQGVGVSLETGMKYAVKYLNPKYILFMDGDYQHDPADIKRFVKEIGKYDLVIGTREMKGLGIIHGFGNAGLRITCLLLTGKFYDPESGFRLWKTESLQKIDFQPGYEVCHTSLIQAHKLGMNIAKIPIKQLKNKNTKGTTIDVGVRILIHAINMFIKTIKYSVEGS